MSFMERRISEYKTAPDVRRVRFGGDKSRRPRTPLVKATSKGELPGAPVLERRKMFEQSESAIPPPVAAGTGFGSVSGRRGSKQRSKDISRSTSFRGTKRLKDESQSPVLGRAKQLGMYNNSSVPMWKKLRNFGHFDLQSIAIDTISTAMGNQEEHNVKKPTGASAAHGDSISTENAGHSNTLVSCCPAFTNEVGGDGDWLSSGNPILLLRESLSVDKQRRVGSRERMILDGELPLKSMVLLRGPMNRQVSQVLLPMTGMSYPFEFIDYGASYYRNYFLHLGESELCTCACACTWYVHTCVRTCVLYVACLVHVCVHVCIQCVCVCVCVRAYVASITSYYVSMYVSMYLNMFVGMYLSMYLSMYW